MSLRDTLLRTLRSAARGVVRHAFRTPPNPAPPAQPGTRRAPAASGYPGDFTGMPPVSYTPMAGRTPDPGEVAWAWVPYEEDHRRGKDRPVLLIGRAEGWLLGLPLTSLDHDRDAAQEAREGRFWMDIGSGAWDAQGRASEVRLDRVVRIDPAKVRRASVALDRALFDAVIAGVRRHATP